MAAPLLWRVAIQVSDEQGAWPHKAHVALDHVDEFWQLIEARPSKERPKARDPALIVHHGSLADFDHSAEFVEGKHFLVEAHPLLSEEYGPSHQDPDEGGKGS